MTFSDLDSVQRAALELSDMVERTQADHHTLRLYLSHAANAVPAVVNRVQSLGLALQSLTLTQPTLDDVFLKVTGERLQVKEPAPLAKGKRARLTRAS